MTQPTAIGRGSWRLRSVPQHLAVRYRSEGWWTDATLGEMVAGGLGSMGHVGFRVRSGARPWRGTFADVDRAARSLAAELRARGVGPGSLVVFQLPNWVEAGITFWAAAYLGAVVVPIVHFYGAKEVEYIVRASEPDVVVTADRFGHADHLATGGDVLAHHPGPLWLVVGDTEPGHLPAAATPFASLLDAESVRGPAAVDPDTPAIVGFTSGTTRDPKGVVHSHRTIGCETRQLDYFFPTGGPPQITGAPVGHFIGMLNAFLVPMLRLRAVNLVPHGRHRGARRRGLPHDHRPGLRHHHPRRREHQRPGDRGAHARDRRHRRGQRGRRPRRAARRASGRRPAPPPWHRHAVAGRGS
jgi:hypothetical protein